MGWMQLTGSKERLWAPSVIKCSDCRMVYSQMGDGGAWRGRGGVYGYLHYQKCCWRIEKAVRDATETRINVVSSAMADGFHGLEHFIRRVPRQAAVRHPCL